MHIGFDIGGTKTVFAIFDANYERVESQRFETRAGTYEDYLAGVEDLVREADGSFPGSHTVGVGITGVVNGAGQSLSVNVPCINGMNVQRDLTVRLGRTVRCVNDVRAFALSEARGGAAEGFRTMVGIILGTGAASGYCLAGEPVLGTDGVAGEWGHLPVDAVIADRYALPIYACSCGKRGCQEQYVSGPGLGRLASHFTGMELDSRACVDRMRQGDPGATRAFEAWLACLSGVVSQLILHLNPAAIVIGGGLSNIDEIYSRLPAETKGRLLDCVPMPPILRARFGDDSGVRGAAIMGAQT